MICNKKTLKVKLERQFLFICDVSHLRFLFRRKFYFSICFILFFFCNRRLVCAVMHYVSDILRNTHYLSAIIVVMGRIKSHKNRSRSYSHFPNFHFQLLISFLFFLGRLLPQLKFFTHTIVYI